MEPCVQSPPQAVVRAGANLFVAGLHLEVTGFDSSFVHILLGTAVEAGIFWLLGATVAIIYNRLTK